VTPEEVRSLFGGAPAAPPAVPEEAPPPTTHGWRGWIKLEGKRWKPVTSADDFGECWSALLRWQPPAGTERMDRVVLLSTRVPWDIYQ